tara:strand:+ start:211 stop:378 length:168 start_codon:yes stop_codon:yes gene_type:complete
MRETFYSKKHWSMLDLMVKPYQNISVLIEKYNLYVEKKLIIFIEKINDREGRKIC